MACVCVWFAVMSCLLLVSQHNYNYLSNKPRNQDQPGSASEQEGVTVEELKGPIVSGTKRWIFLVIHR